MIFASILLCVCGRREVGGCILGHEVKCISSVGCTQKSMKSTVLVLLLCTKYILVQTRYNRQILTGYHPIKGNLLSRTLEEVKGLKSIL